MQAHVTKNPDGYSYYERVNDVTRQMLALLPWARERGMVVPDFDLAWTVQDFPSFSNAIPLPAPAHSMSEGRMESDIAIPDMSFRLWPRENGVGEEQSMLYDQLIDRVLAAGDHASRPYGSRIRKALFRGAIPSTYAERNVMAEVALRRPEAFDIGTWRQPDAKKVGLQNASRYAVILSIPGNGWMARLKYALASGSPVIVLQEGNGRYDEFWYHRLRPFEEYWPIRSMAELEGAVDFLLARPKDAERIGAAGRAFVASKLRPVDVKCYWMYYLTYYASLFEAGRVEPGEKAMAQPFQGPWPL